jgi:amino acid permease
MLQMPSLHDARLSSLLGALMSAAYCIIAVAMCATVKPSGVNYNPAAVGRTPINNVMGIFNALTTVLFAYGGHNVALEIQATIGRTEKYPSTVQPMMKGVNWTFVITGKHC